MGLTTTVPRRLFALAAACALVLTALVLSKPARAATAGSVYSYTLDGSTAVVPNGAATNTGVALNLFGDWSPSAFGVHFTGNLTSTQSVGYARPSTGNTLDVPATHSVGAAIKFRYQQPASGSCFSDSSNLTQIGRFGAGLGQVKIQFSNCGNSSTSVFVQCRMAGSSSSTSDLPVSNSQALVDGATYVAKCSKAPDPATGKAALRLQVTKVDPVAGNLVTANNFSINPTGTITSSAYLSVANKYALTTQAGNTDQFNGDVAKVAYCQAASVLAVRACLDTEIP